LCVKRNQAQDVGEDRWSDNCPALQGNFYLRPSAFSNRLSAPPLPQMKLLNGTVWIYGKCGSLQIDSRNLAESETFLFICHSGLDPESRSGGYGGGSLASPRPSLDSGVCQCPAGRSSIQGANMGNITGIPTVHIGDTDRYRRCPLSRYRFL